MKKALQRLKALGATVDEVSIPMHIAGYDIWNAIIIEGATEMMIKGNGLGHGWEGTYTTSLLDAYARGWRSRPQDMSETVKLVLFMGEYMHRYYHGRYYAKGQNLKWALRQAYDDVLAKYDLLAMPTIPFTATKIPEAGLPARGICGARARHDRQHLPVRRQRPPRHERAVRARGRAAGGADADGPALRRGDGATGGGGVREAGGLEEDVDVLARHCHVAMKLLRLQGIGSRLGFWLAWTLVAIVAAACMYLPSEAPLRWLGVSPYAFPLYLGLSLSQLILFWLVAAGGQGIFCVGCCPAAGGGAS